MTIRFQYPDGTEVTYGWHRLFIATVLWLWRVTFHSFLIGLIFMQLDTVWPRFGALGPMQYWLLAFAGNMFLLGRRFHFVIE